MKKDLSRGDEVYSEDVFQVLVDYEISRSKRYPSPVSLIHIEITPSAMDEESLRAAPSIFAAALNSHLRSVDIPSGAKHNYRVLLPTADMPGTRSVCERLLSVFSSRFNTKTGQSIAFTLNIGAASASSSANASRETLFEQAENALKHSRLKGPNTFVHFGDM